MSPIGNIVGVIRQEHTLDIAAKIVETYDRVTEDGLYRRKTEGFEDSFIYDRETEGAP